ncbi:MAG: hypothetical protein ACRBM6_24045 [Geminicoccales bacterium]
MRLAIITGADSAYFELMEKLLTALSSARAGQSYDLCVLDFGLSADQVATATGFGATVVRPEWAFDAPANVRTTSNLGYGTRPILPRYFPGYDLYLWLDADISVQDDKFISSFTAASMDGSLAIAEEVDRSYQLEPYALKWQIGNAFRCFGIRDGLKLCLGRPINSGVFALRGDAPHWAIWQQRYQQAIDRAGRANLDQHALMAALYLDDMPCRYLDSTHNWICTRSQPLWDEVDQVFRRPYAPFEKIDVLHLAGRHKDKLWDVKTLRGATRRMYLSYCRRQEGLSNGEPEVAIV